MLHRFARRFVCLVIILTLTLPAFADRVRWLETASWSGKGMMTTEPFVVTSDRWRVVVRRSAAEPRNVLVLDSEGNEFARILVLERGVPSVKALRGAGTYYLAIEEPEGEWNMRVQQKLSVVEEWELRKILRSPPPPLDKIAVWAGAEGVSRFPFSVPAGRAWKLVVRGETEDGGSVRLRVTQLGTTEISDFVRYADGEVSCDQWFPKGGEFELTVSAEKATWRAEVQAR